MEQPGSDGHVERCRMQVRDEKRGGNSSRDTKRNAEKTGAGSWEVTAASLCCPSSAQSELCHTSRKTTSLIIFY